MNMKRTLISLSILMALLLVAAGCNNSGYAKADKVAGSMTKLNAEMTAAKDDINMTITALDDVVRTASTKSTISPAEAFTAFQKQVKQTKKQADKVTKIADKMHKEGQAYFAKWEEEYAKITNEDMRKQFEARREQLNAKHVQLQKDAENVKNTYNTFIKQVSDIESYLSMSLTKDSIKSLSGQIKAASANADAAVDAIDNFLGEMSKISAEMKTAAQNR